MSVGEWFFYANGWWANIYIYIYIWYPPHGPWFGELELCFFPVFYAFCCLLEVPCVQIHTYIHM